MSGSPVIAPDSLDWVTFSSEEDELCEARSMPCGRQAAAVAIWQTVSPRCPERQPLCLEHADLALRRSAGYGQWFCGCRLLRIEPIR